MKPGEKVEYLNHVPKDCRRCGGTMKENAAGTFDSDVLMGDAVRQPLPIDPETIYHLYSCLTCGHKHFAPPSVRPDPH